jgi:hypothetical protein
MQRMTRDEWRAFLLEQPRTAQLATVRADGRPHLAPIWFDLDGDTLVFTTWHESVKAANLGRDGRGCLGVDEEQPPFAFVQLDGVATLSQDPAELRLWATRIAGRYIGAALAEAYGQRNSVLGELLVRVAITKVVAMKGISE